MRFPLFGVPVTLHWSAALWIVFGYNFYPDDLLAMVGWIAAVFAAVLFHEGGHAAAARGFGATNVSVTLFALGGYTTWVPRRNIGPGKRFIISGAGSAVPIVLGLVVVLLARQGLFEGMPTWANAFLETFVVFGLFWGVLNWIPMLPLDGGHMLQNGLALLVPRHADRITVVVTVLVGAALIIGAFYFGEPFLAIFLIFILMSGLRSIPSSTPESKRPPAQPQPREATERSETERDQEPPAFPI